MNEPRSFATRRELWRRAREGEPLPPPASAPSAPAPAPWWAREGDDDEPIATPPAPAAPVDSLGPVGGGGIEKFPPLEASLTPKLGDLFWRQDQRKSEEPTPAAFESETGDPERFCRFCGASLPPRKKGPGRIQKWCSPACSRRGRAGLRIALARCRRCGAEFGRPINRPSSLRSYCSSECRRRYAYEHETPEQRAEWARRALDRSRARTAAQEWECAACGNPFAGRKRIYCSAPCRDRASYLRRRALTP